MGGEIFISQEYILVIYESESYRRNGIQIVSTLLFIFIVKVQPSTLTTSVLKSMAFSLSGMRLVCLLAFVLCYFDDGV